MQPGQAVVVLPGVAFGRVDRAPGIIIRMRIVACAGTIVGAEERIVAVIGDAGTILDGGGAMGIVISSGIRDLPTHPSW